MEYKRLICPDIRNCPIYTKWVKRTKNRRLDIIVKSIRPDSEGIYLCVAKINLENKANSYTQCLNEKIANITDDIKKLFEQYK